MPKNFILRYTPERKYIYGIYIYQKACTRVFIVILLAKPKADNYPNIHQ